MTTSELDELVGIVVDAMAQATARVEDLRAHHATRIIIAYRQFGKAIQARTQRDHEQLEALRDESATGSDR